MAHTHYTYVCMYNNNASCAAYMHIYVHNPMDLGGNEQIVQRVYPPLLSHGSWRRPAPSCLLPSRMHELCVIHELFEMSTI